MLRFFIGISSYTYTIKTCKGEVCYDSRKLTVTQNYTTGYYSFSKFIDIDNITTVPTEIELKL